MARRRNYPGRLKMLFSLLIVLVAIISVFMPFLQNTETKESILGYNAVKSGISELTKNEAGFIPEKIESKIIIITDGVFEFKALNGDEAMKGVMEQSKVGGYLLTYGLILTLVMLAFIALFSILGVIFNSNIQRKINMVFAVLALIMAIVSIAGAFVCAGAATLGLGVSWVGIGMLIASILFIILTNIRSTYRE